MIRLTPSSTRTDTLLPYPTLFRSRTAQLGAWHDPARSALEELHQFLDDARDMRHRGADLAPLLGDLHRGDVEELDHGAVRALGPLGDHHPAVAGEVAHRKRAAPAERRPALRQVGGSTLPQPVRQHALREAVAEIRIAGAEPELLLHVGEQRLQLAIHPYQAFVAVEYRHAARQVAHQLFEARSEEHTSEPQS